MMMMTTSRIEVSPAPLWDGNRKKLRSESGRLSQRGRERRQEGLARRGLPNHVLFLFLFLFFVLAKACMTEARAVIVVAMLLT